MTLTWQGFIYLVTVVTFLAGGFGIYQTLRDGHRRHEAWKERMERTQAMEASMMRHESEYQAKRAEHAERLIAELRAELDALKGEAPQQPTWYAEAMEDGSPPTHAP